MEKTTKPINKFAMIAAVSADMSDTNNPEELHKLNELLENFLLENSKESEEKNA